MGLSSTREILDVTKALADGSRLRVLMALAGGELCVCQIVRDRKELQRILGMDPEQLCKEQGKS